MSHFKVLVIGDSVEEQLAPYDENISVTPYRDPDWDHDSALKFSFDVFDRYKEGVDGRDPAEVEGIDRDNPTEVLMHVQNAMFGDERVSLDEDGISYLMTTYNPKSKWDYWVVGGRYNASFVIKPDASEDDFTPSAPHWPEDLGNDADHRSASDHAFKRAIDYGAMILRARAQAQDEWAEYRQAVGDSEPPANSFYEFQKHYEDINDANEAWSKSAWVQATTQISLFASPEDFFVGADNPRQAYIDHAENMAVAGYYAVVKDGEWYARGNMGWFGMSDDEIDHDEWLSQVRDMIAGLPGDTLLTTVDCHI